MRSIPAEPDFSEAQSAEKVVWEKLRLDLPDEVVVAHSVQVRHGRAECEIDLLVFWPGVGLAAIEVKGGLISIAGGQWYQSGGAEGRRGIQSPVAQSQSSMHAFRTWMSEQIGSPISSRFAYMVCFPYTSVPQSWEMAGCPRSLVLDRDDLTSPVELIRTAIEREGSGTTPLAASFMERMLPKLGQLDSKVDLAYDAREVEDEQNHLTERQAILLAATRSLPRVRFIGGAGSGKTWLAVEKAKRLAKEGKRVGLFCYNKGLSQYLRNQVQGWRQATPVFTGEFHDYALTLGVRDGEGQEYFDDQLPRELLLLAGDLANADKLDAVVVDEAQDFAPLWWDALKTCLKDPASSEIYAFMDDQQDVYRRWKAHTLEEGTAPLADLVPIHVDDNLRNTRRIAETFKGFAGAHFRPRGVTGLPVRRVHCSTEDALDVAGDCVDALIEDGWANNQIALLTTQRRHPIHLEHFENGTIADYWREFHRDDAEFYGHVLGFKGLERSVIILCVNGFRDAERAAEQLYVGLSRARSLLVIVGDDAEIIAAGGRRLELALRTAEVWKPAS
ncbi:AAA family ATPase [Arthrobacter sp. KR32]|uniref:AAA family ATPase n=2 Tax=Arthrobacter bussei TaxID=2594179 RepID=A0A7X1TP28_9MICC|nr:NERD domain-containing protein/DEAD/DEAH box helicase [Arthrobacter bussei]MPY11183.1 AAA family ATPase [Arthrobacter bussei]